MPALVTIQPKHATQGPVGQRGARAQVLKHLKLHGSATAASLAAALGCSLNAVRHHLKELDLAGLVQHHRVHQGVGAPAHRYQLSPDGDALFPAQYASIVVDLLDRLVALEGREASVASLRAHYGVLGMRLRAEAGPLPAERRGDRIAQLLDAEGFMATWNSGAKSSSQGGGSGTLVEHNCPHRLVAERFPEVCAAEEAFLSAAFGAPVERLSQISGGCGCCSYRVTLSASASDDTTTECG